LLQLLEETSCLPRTESAQELELIVPVVMLNKKVDVNSYIIDSLHIDLFQHFHQSVPIHILLERMHVEIESLIFI